MGRSTRVFLFFFSFPGYITCSQVHKHIKKSPPAKNTMVLPAVGLPIRSLFACNGLLPTSSLSSFSPTFLRDTMYFSQDEWFPPLAQRTSSFATALGSR